MEKAVLEALGDKKPEELLDLHIEGAISANVVGISEDFKNLQELELLNCGLKSLEGLPHLPSVKTLILGDNKLKGKQEVERVVSQCPSIENLNFVGNNFEAIDDIKPLENLETLTSLDLFNCPLTQQNGYRDKVWNLLPKLTILDGYDRDGKEVGDEEEEAEEIEDDEEEEDQEESDEEVGLEYLQRELSSADEEDEYNPEAAESPPSDDHEIIDEEPGKEGQSSSSKRNTEDVEENEGPTTKKPKLDQPLENDSDEDEDD